MISCSEFGGQVCGLDISPFDPDLIFHIVPLEAFPPFCLEESLCFFNYFDSIPLKPYDLV
jgi:hypothetical protein